MSVARATVIKAAQAIAQDPTGTAKLLLDDAAYGFAIDQAIQVFRGDRPNLRVVHVTVVSAGFRFVLKGTGAILSSSGLDRWIDGASQLQAVDTAYDTASQSNSPLDRNGWRVTREPSLVVLELLQTSVGIGSVLRLEFTSPHDLSAADPAQTSILEGDVTTFEILVAAEICAMTARRYVQNTGTSTFQNESVDRRTQSDIMASRAKELRARYAEIVGKGSGEGSTVAGAAAVKKFAIATAHRRGRLWHRD